MISIIRKTGLLSIVMMLQMNLTGCASMVLGFSAEPITATVVDADTKQPLKDVIVVAHWQLVGGGSFVDSSVPVGELMVMEAVTNAEGKFHFPAWGPKYDFMGRMHNDDPQLIIFKPGYEFQVLSNEWKDMKDYQAVRRSDWDGKTLVLKKFIGSEKEYTEHVYNLDRKTDFARYYGKRCEWLQMPRLLNAIEEVGIEAETKGILIDGWRIGARIRKVSEVDKYDECRSK
jgi:hypothetical protein